MVHPLSGLVTTLYVRFGGLMPQGLGGAGSEYKGFGSGGGQSTGSGGAPATEVPSAPPTGSSASPQMVRAILSGIWTPAEAGPEAPMSPVLEGMVNLDSANRVLPELIARSSATRSPLSLVLVRPGKAGDTEPAPPGGIADLAAALTVSLAPSQQLLQSGPGHLAVAVTGGPRAARRHAQRLMARAALAGAPVLTWAMASYPRDGSSSAALIQTATGRLQLPARTRAAAAGHGRGALWAGVAAAALVGVVAYTVGSGHGPKSPSASSAVADSGQSALSAAGGSSPSSGTSTSGQAGAVQTSVPPSWIGGSRSGTSGSSTAGGSVSGPAGTSGGGGGTSPLTPSG